jgi:hypothetical protein
VSPSRKEKISLRQLRDFTRAGVGETYEKTGIERFYLFRARAMIVPRLPGKPDPLGPSQGLANTTILDTAAEEKVQHWIDSIWRIAGRAND